MSEIENKYKIKLNSFFKDPYNLILIGILLFAFLIRLYYFFITKNQPIWWDEGDYLNMGKFWADGIPKWRIDPLRPLLFPFLLSIFYRFGANEIFIRILMMLIPVATVFLLYLIGKEMYNKKVGLVAAFILAFFWPYLFYSNRILTDIPMSFLWLLTVYLFWKWYVKNKNKKYIWLVGFFAALTFLMKFTGILVSFTILAYLLLTERFKILKNKNLLLIGIVAILTSLPYFIYSYFKFGNPFRFYVEAVGERFVFDLTFFQISKDYIKFLFPSIGIAFLILFLIGLLTFINLIFGFDLFLKGKENKLNSDFFVLLWMIIHFLGMIKLGHAGLIEERLNFMFYMPVFLTAGKGVVLIYNLINKIINKYKNDIKIYSKAIAFIFIFIILIFGAYNNIVHADQIINAKKNSFVQVKEAGTYIKENTLKEDVILSTQTQAELQYHSERTVVGSGGTKEEIYNLIKEFRPKYFVVSVFLPQALNDPDREKFFIPAQNPDLFKPVLAFEPFVDQQMSIPIVTVYEVNQEQINKI